MGVSVERDKASEYAKQVMDDVTAHWKTAHPLFAQLRENTEALLKSAYRAGHAAGVASVGARSSERVDMSEMA
jgi:hypothetical protein